MSHDQTDAFIHRETYKYAYSLAYRILIS